MAGRVPESEYFGRQKAERDRTKRDVEDLQRIDGSQFLRLYEKMTALFAGLNATVTSVVQSLTFTRAEINSKIASPGAISPTTVSASGAISTTGGITGGDLTASGAVRLPGTLSWSNPNFRTLTVGDDGRVGVSQSSQRYKQDIRDLDADVVEAAFRQVNARRYRFIADVERDEENAPLHTGLIAEELVAVGITTPVFFDREGRPDGINYDRLTPHLWAMVQRLLDDRDARDEREAATAVMVAALTERITALEAQTGHDDGITKWIPGSIWGS